MRAGERVSVISGCKLQKKTICLPATVVAPVMLDLIQLAAAALCNMPPSEAATGQRGGGRV